MYYENEIKSTKNWVTWLVTFQVEEERLADEADRNKIASSISFNFHKKGTARFETYKRDNEFYVKRIK